jgi:hypothetical protein
MSFDPRRARGVAWRLAVLVVGGPALAGLTGCPPRTTAPEAPGPEPTPASVEQRRPVTREGQSAMLGELCPTAAGGRPGLAPLAARTVSWTSEPDDLEAPLSRGQTGAFAVLGLDGRRVGVFGAIGLSDQTPGSVAVGSYAGGSTCASAVTPGSKPTDDAACVAATGGCGLAIALVSTGGGFNALDPPDVAIGGACVSDGNVVTDIDGDGAPEVFPLTSFLDGSRAPADELAATTAGAAACTPSFSRFGLAVAVDAAIADPRHKVTLDILGVLDLDGDGRRELVVGLRYSERRTIAVYSALESATRLALIGESEPWPKQ